MSPAAICCGTTPSLESTLPPKPATRILMPLKSAGVFSSLRNQPKGRPAGIAGRDADHAHAVIDLVHQLLAVAVKVPGVLLARGHAEGQRSVEDQRRVLADVVAAVGMAALDSAV